ncbi:pseudaminic acid biosynthesis protein PseG [Thalassotalea euphylliae]|uniref:Pseudaminic acid biosynthesis protein PseG n=1 Tax=Thalassotalea euphylliae TaxID=1655234 RepID=A0A3E0TNQ7_9GAMM|nr:pseudaminic acid biosynthesis protein PseG [Thalassotalea euphylliae]REL26063.1 pseudaminic acid biosynthesis protein PseG [Thalassotalea euphylliae]
MINFAIRVASQQGIGHLMRMKWLAHALIQRGCQVIFILDECTQASWQNITDVAEQLYFVNIGNSRYSQHSDAFFTNEILVKHQCQRLIIDSYQLGVEYERAIDKQVNITVFDDLAREHHCHQLFDMKWCAEHTDKRYKDKLPDECQRYLGPAFALLAPGYRQQNFNTKSRGVHSNHTIRQTIHPSASKNQNLLISLGGGGDLSLLEPFIYHLVERAPALQINLVVGPQAINHQSVECVAAEHTNLTLINHPKSLISYYEQADLFVGALGTSLYELAACQLPAITFSIADNQENDILALEDLGHYFHLDSYYAAQGEKLAALTQLVLQQLPRVNTLRTSAKLTVDGCGAERVAEVLLAPNSAQHELTRDHVKYDKDQLESNKKQASRGYSSEPLTDKVAIRQVDDQDINRYLNARNLPVNAQRMTINEEIPRLSHYHWWFTTDRVSYLLSENGQDRLYIWDSKQQINGQDYLYGGWFTAAGEVPFNLAMLALKWQLSRSKTEHTATWLAVIHKENKFVNLLNQYMGFKETRCEQAIAATQVLFPCATAAQFNYVSLACKDIHL